MMEVWQHVINRIHKSNFFSIKKRGGGAEEDSLARAKELLCRRQYAFVIIMNL